jgi:hypothetical protein
MFKKERDIETVSIYKKHPLNLKLKDYYVKFRNKNTIQKSLTNKSELRKSGNNTKLKWWTINNIIIRNKKLNHLKELLNNSKNKNVLTDKKPEYVLAEKYFRNVATDLNTSLKNRKNTYDYTTNFDKNSLNRVPLINLILSRSLHTVAMAVGVGVAIKLYTLIVMRVRILQQ